MANMTVRMIAAEPGVGEPIHGTITLDFESWRAVLVEILAIFVLDRFGVAGPIRDRGHDAQDKRRRERHRSRRDDLFHGISAVTSHRLAVGILQSRLGAPP